MEFTNIFVVYDPVREKQPALERAIIMAQQETSVNLHVFACIYSDIPKSAGKPGEVKELIAGQEEALNAVVASLVDRGVRVTTEVEWDKDWYHAVVRSSVKNSADVVLKSSYRHTASQRILNRTSDWTLIRECLCPVMLVKEDTPQDAHKVLAAIDIRAEKESSGNLNQRIIDFSQKVLERQHTEVHFVSAHKDASSSPDRNALIRSCGVQSDKIHIKRGQPDDVIVAKARKLGANLVVVGNSARSGFSALVNGNTVEKVLDRLECDILSMP